MLRGDERRSGSRMKTLRGEEMVSTVDCPIEREEERK